MTGTVYTFGPSEIRFMTCEIRGKTHYTIDIRTPEQQCQVGISPTGRRITPCEPWKRAKRKEEQ